MDIAASIFTVVNKGIEAFAWAQSKGYLGGSADSTLAKLAQYAELWGRAQKFALMLVSNPAEYDRINGLPQAEKEVEIAKHVYPTPLKDLVERVHDEMTGPA